jgi:hypothetical protein
VLSPVEEHVTLGLVILYPCSPSHFDLAKHAAHVLSHTTCPHSTLLSSGSQTQVTLVSGKPGLAPTDVPNSTVLNCLTSPMDDAS